MSSSLFKKQLTVAHQTKVVAAAIEFHRTISLVAFRDISATAMEAGGGFGSPFWSGRFRASNNISINNPDFSILPPNPSAGNYPMPVSSPYKSKTLSDAQIVLKGLKIYDKVYISNGLPYAKRIEAGGWSAQVPNGVYNVVAERIRNRFSSVSLRGLMNDLSI